MKTKEGGEMDLQKEREAFESWLFDEYERAINFDIVFCEHEQAYNHVPTQARWETWQAAKAQAVPEGFVLVNKKDLVKVLNCVTDDWLIDTDSFEEFKKIESLVQDEVNAMLEAQEPTND